MAERLGVGSAGRRGKRSAGADECNAGQGHTLKSREGSKCRAPSLKHYVTQEAK